jgi:hypothetical protein
LEESGGVVGLVEVGELRWGGWGGWVGGVRRMVSYEWCSVSYNIWDYGDHYTKYDKWM